MPIALQRSEGGGGGGGGAAGRYKVDPPGLITRIPFIAMYGSSDPPIRRFGGGKPGGEGEKEQDLDSCSSSSIGKNSDLSVDSAEGEDSAENEAQSGFNGPLDTLDSLEDVLPVKKGISNFYSGKSKSFTSLADAASISSIKDLGKPENAYSRKRKNLLASTLYWEKNAADKTSKQNKSGLYKRQASANRGACSDSNSSETSNSSSSSPSRGLPPLHPRSIKGNPSTELASPPCERSIPPCRSLSLSDLHCVAAAVAPSSVTGARDK